MALDIYSDEGEHPIRIRISLRELPLVEPAFKTLHRRTGNFIDPYGRSRIHPDHQRILIEAISGSREPKVVELRELLRRTVQEGLMLYAEGD